MKAESLDMEVIVLDLLLIRWYVVHLLDTPSSLVLRRATCRPPPTRSSRPTPPMECTPPLDTALRRATCHKRGSRTAVSCPGPAWPTPIQLTSRPRSDRIGDRKLVFYSACSSRDLPPILNRLNVESPGGYWFKHQALTDTVLISPFSSYELF